MTQAEHIRLTAEGMIRNFGTQAAEKAEAAARRHGGVPDGRTLWEAVADKIRSMAPMPGT